MVHSGIRDILKPFIPICETIGKTFGSQCEVVLHDLSQPEKSVVYLVNPTVTDRKIGDSFYFLMNKMLMKDRYENDTLINYTFTAKNGTQVKSSTVFLRDQEQNVFGAICINVKLDTIKEFIEILNHFCSDLMPENTSTALTHTDIEKIECIDDIVDKMIQKIIPSDPHNLSKSRKIEIIRFLIEKGIFNSKGAIDKVASQLGVSKVTVYSYMDEIKKDCLDFT